MTDDETFTPEDLAVHRAIGGTVDGMTLLRAHVAANAGEHRPQQETMVAAVQEAIASRTPLICQAGTGTGKSLAYLFPLAASGARAVIATATNQLSEQLTRHDLPQVQQTVEASGKTVTYALLKGRNNYACLQKISEIENLEAAGAAHASDADRLFDLPEADDSSALKRRQAKADAAEVGKLLTWVKTTSTGDRSDAPTVVDRVWAQVSTSAADCPGAASCPFSDQCFTEIARNRARAADIVITNHALLAQEVRTSSAGTGNPNANPASAGLFGKRDVLIVDEAHDLPDALTGALSTEVDPRALGKFLSKAAKYIHDTSITDDGEPATIAVARDDLEHLTDLLEQLPTGPLDTLPAATVDRLQALTTRLITIAGMLRTASATATREEKAKRAAAITVIADQAESLAEALGDARTLTPGRVRWVDRRSMDVPPVLRTAPLEVGEQLNRAIDGRTFIATSATLTVGSSFTPIQRTLGMENDVTCIDVGSPFPYATMGMLYIPKSPFPEPVGRDRAEHTQAVLDELVTLVTAAGGRTLALFTTTAGAQRAAEHLRTHLPHLTVHAHGEAPADVLVQQFADEETSVLCATMGLWQGVNVVGPSCSLVVIDKVGFAPIDDVLTAARRALADSRGRDGFTDVVVAQASTSLAQAAGRLIRAATDKGVVAILDPRLHTKGYGRTLLASLPAFRVFHDRDTVTAALTRLTGGTDDAARAAAPAPVSRPKSGTSAGKPGGSGIRRASATRNIAKKNLRPRKID